MTDLPKLGTVWRPRQDEGTEPRLLRRPGVVVGTLDQPSVTLQYADGTQSKVALSVLYRDMRPAPTLSDVPEEELRLELHRRQLDSMTTRTSGDDR